MKWNSFFCTSEWCLFTAIMDKNSKYRSKAANIINQIRLHKASIPVEDKVLRRNLLPSEHINFKAKDFWGLLPLEKWAKNPNEIVKVSIVEKNQSKKVPMKVIDAFLHDPPLLGDFTGDYF